MRKAVELVLPAGAPPCFSPLFLLVWRDDAGAVTACATSRRRAVATSGDRRGAGRPAATRGAGVLQPHARKAGTGARRCYNRHAAVLRSARGGDGHCWRLLQLWLLTATTGDNKCYNRLRRCCDPRAGTSSRRGAGSSEVIFAGSGEVDCWNRAHQMLPRRLPNATTGKLSDASSTRHHMLEPCSPDATTATLECCIHDTTRWNGCHRVLPRRPVATGYNDGLQGKAATSGLIYWNRHRNLLRRGRTRCHRCCSRRAAMASSATVLQAGGRGRRA